MDWKAFRQGSLNQETQIRKDLGKLAADLNKFDWFFAMSDDSSTYHRGLAEQQRLWAVARSLGEQGVKLYEQVRTARTKQD